MNSLIIGFIFVALCLVADVLGIGKEEDND